jgi:hypothetical protein
MPSPRGRVSAAGLFPLPHVAPRHPRAPSPRVVGDRAQFRLPPSGSRKRRRRSALGRTCAETEGRRRARERRRTRVEEVAGEGGDSGAPPRRPSERTRGRREARLAVGAGRCSKERDSPGMRSPGRSRTFCSRGCSIRWRLNISHSFCKMQMRRWMKTLLVTV